MPEGQRRVAAGGLVQVTDAPGAPPASAPVPAVAPRPVAAPSAPAAQPATRPASQPERPERSPEATPTWKALARRGAWEEAYRSLGTDGLRAATGAARTAEELLVLADVARMSGHPAEAVAPLEEAVRRNPADGRGAVAAFTLGRLQLDSLGDPRRAAESLLRAITIGLPPALEEDAWVRLVEARVRSKDPAGARISARAYERRFPEGRHRVEVKRWLDGR
jgi:transmembrane sensor